MSKKKLLNRKELDQFYQILLEKYTKDPEAINNLFPELAQRLSFLTSEAKPFTSSSGLTERERTYNQEALRRILSKLNEDNITSDEAIKGMELAAVLIEDNNMPSEITYSSLTALLQKAINISLVSLNKSLIFPVKDGKIVKNIPLVRGVISNLTWDNQLISVSIDIKKMRDRHVAIRFIGIARNESPDVAEEHDKYLSEALTR